MNILRWLLLLPISILCSIIFPYLYKQIVELFVSENTFADSYLLNGANFFLQGTLFIVSTYFIAPKFKIQTLKIFLILWFLTVVFGDYYLYSTHRENIGIWNSLLRIIGALLAYINITLEHKDETIHLINETNEETKQEKPNNNNDQPKLTRSQTILLRVMKMRAENKE
ncbi:hypothetical protein SAMN05444395_107183 [Flavobacterium fryxellicola]|uniref:Uncharacterized protein n=1 Tax=Flavobacterium fryxellicola TaxID=249352 RepID=A0A167YUQ2_9FLAO|nr:hypothetical protein [Flavobacterium fryxellicola]OAB29810.1 hypothetical protein FBFR_03570 [Flavobacterium fryxellicola]SHN73193.1 hypothetical protein SAMN05444395_107183 [Flavobacterium fryxellicola]